MLRFLDTQQGEKNENTLNAQDGWRANFGI
jgi:hypothetical protein